MKTSPLILLLCGLFVYVGCWAPADSQAETTDSSSKAPSQNRKKVMYVTGDDFALFYNPFFDEFYLAQPKSTPSLSGELELREYAKGRLVIGSAADASATVYVLGDNAYGISKMKGNKFKKAFLKKDMSGFVPDIEAAVKSMSCGCLPDTEEAQKECASGGSGAIDCGHSRKLKAVASTSEVSCGKGYFACCQ